MKVLIVVAALAGIAVLYALGILFTAWLIRIVLGAFDHPLDVGPSIAAALLFSALTFRGKGETLRKAVKR